MLDSIMGSGTALVVAATLGRRGFGFDIDPLAVRIIQAKTMLNTCDLNDEKCDVVGQSRRLLQDTELVEPAIQSRFDDDTKKFIRRMPVSRIANSESGIERRMHNEHVIGLWKP